MWIQTECISFENRWTISSSYDLQVHLQHFQRRCFPQTALQWLNVLPGAPRWTWRPLHQYSKLGKGVIHHQRVWGSVRAFRAVRNTQEILMETRVVADVRFAIGPISFESLSNNIAFEAKFAWCRWVLNEYQSDNKSDSGRSKID
jgi:hypothetical protein